MRKLFRQPWLEVRNGVIPLEDAGEPALLELRERVQLATNFEARCKLAETFLLTRLRSAVTDRDVVDFSLELFHADLSVNFADVARRTNYTPRHLRRIFTREMGISPKAYHQVKRITYVLASLYRGKYKSLTELAYAAGYSDQAHLNRNFRKFMGVSPRQFMQDLEKSANSKLSHWAEEDI